MAAAVILGRLRRPQPLRLLLFCRPGRLVAAPMTRRRIAWGLLRFLAGANFCRNFGRRGLVHPWNCLASQTLDGADGLAVDRRDDRNCGAASPGPAGAADAMDVIVGVVRHIEIEDVAHLRNVQAARGHIRRDQQLNFTAAETDRVLPCAPTDPCRRAGQPH